MSETVRYKNEGAIDQAVKALFEPAGYQVTPEKDGTLTLRHKVRAFEVMHRVYPDDTVSLVDGEARVEDTGPRPIEGSFMCMCYGKPPVYDQVLAAFGVRTDTTLFTFGDVIYNPTRIHVPADFIAHEEVHAAQQGHTPEGAGRWWARYFQDPLFRVDQEARAFARQYDWWCEHDKHGRSREQRFHKRRDLAARLAAPTYGRVVGFEGAVGLIKQFSKTK